MQSTQPLLDSSIQIHLGRHLRAEYKEVCAAPLPPRLAELVLSLEEVLLQQGGAALPDIRDGMLEALPGLRAFAVSLTTILPIGRVAYRPEATHPVRQLRPGRVSKSTSYRSSLAGLISRSGLSSVRTAPVLRLISM
jgi:hypothetical protein